MAIVRAQHHHDPDRRPLLDPYQLGQRVAAALAALRSIWRDAMARRLDPPDTSIAWEDGEAAQRPEDRR